MNLKDDILKSYSAIFNAANYPRAIAWGRQKPKNSTFVQLAIDGKSQVLKTTGGAVYYVNVSFTMYSNSEIRFLQDEIDKLTNILDSNHYYRDSTKTYFFNALTSGVDIPGEGDDWKFRINVTLTYEEVV